MGDPVDRPGLLRRSQAKEHRAVNIRATRLPTVSGLAQGCGMTIPNAETAAPVVTDEEVLERVTQLVHRAHIRQLWLLLLDEHGRQSPILPVVDLPANPDESDGFAEFLRALQEATGAVAVAPVLERPGPLELRPRDRAWLGMFAEAVAEAELRLRGPLLAHSRGVRWVAAEDLASAPAVAQR